MDKIRDPKFAERLERASIDHPHCPTELTRGKQKWVREKIEELYAPTLSASPEAVRKWFAGEARPRPKMMKALAEILNVDEAWLALGIVPDMSQKERKKRARTAEGGAMLLAGLIQISGGHPSFPSPGDIDRPDLIAIIDGEAVEIDAPLAKHLETGAHSFTIKRGYEQRKVVGIVPNGFGARLISLSKKVIKDFGVVRGDFIELIATEANERFSVGGIRTPEVTSLAMLTLD